MFNWLIDSIADALTDDTRSQALQSLREFSAQFSRASAPLRMALDIALGKCLSIIEDTRELIHCR